MHDALHRKSRTAASALAAAALLALTAGSACAAAGESARTAVYRDAQHVSETRIAGGKWTEGPVASAALARSAEARGLMMESTSQPALDCGDSNYRCVASGIRTFAVPQSGLRKSSRYRVREVEFVVEDCLQALGDRCVVALVSASCAEIVLEGGCKPAGKKPRRADAGHVDYFIFHGDFGITAMGSTGRLARNADARRAVASQLVLVSERGLLAP